MSRRIKWIDPAMCIDLLGQANAGVAVMNGVPGPSKYISCAWSTFAGSSIKF